MGSIILGIIATLVLIISLFMLFSLIYLMVTNEFLPRIFMNWLINGYRHRKQKKIKSGNFVLCKDEKTLYLYEVDIIEGFNKYCGNVLIKGKRYSYHKKEKFYHYQGIFTDRCHKIKIIPNPFKITNWRKKIEGNNYGS